jgi:hypothetical protein
MTMRERKLTLMLKVSTIMTMSEAHDHAEDEDA